MQGGETITLKRACEVLGIPSGNRDTLAAGSVVRLMQLLGGSYTVVSDLGYMYRLDAKDADALGLSGETSPTVVEGAFNEKMAWEQMKTIYDPEIPVNIVDLGLVYACDITPLEQGGKRIDVQMSMTAPGCGMGNVLKADVESKLSRLPEVKEVHVTIVFDPPWTPARMSAAAKLQLGFDLDVGGDSSSLPVFGR